MFVSVHTLQCVHVPVFILIKSLNKLSSEQVLNLGQQLDFIYTALCVCMQVFLAGPEPRYYLRERVALYGEEKQP